MARSPSSCSASCERGSPGFPRLRPDDRGHAGVNRAAFRARHPVALCILTLAASAECGIFPSQISPASRGSCSMAGIVLIYL